MDNAFERVVAVRTRPGYSVEPVSIAWNAVAFSLRGQRDAVACIPRRSLGPFLDDLDAGRLDATITGFLEAPPSGRVLRAASQTETPGLFDELASPDAISPVERVPGRTRRFGDRGGGTPWDVRREKGSRRPRLRRLSVLAAGAAVVAVLGVIAAVAQRDSDDTTAVVAANNAQSTTTSLTTTTTTPVAGSSSCDSRNLVQDCSFESPAVGAGGVAAFAPGSKVGAWTVGRRGAGGIAEPSDAIDLVHKDFFGRYPVHGGSQSLDLNRDRPGGVFQDVPTSPGRSYRLTFFVSGYPAASAPCPATDPQTLTVIAGSASQSYAFKPSTTANPPGAQQFDEETLTFEGTPGSTTTLVSFNGTNDGCAGAIIDDVTITG